MSMKSAPCVHGVSRVTAVLTSAAHEQTRGVADMVTRDTRWPAGAPCWVDVSVDDVPKAIAFYQALFGWDVQAGGPEAGGYATAYLRGRIVAGIRPKSGAPHAPAAWTVYLATDDADATADAIQDRSGFHYAMLTVGGREVGGIGRHTEATPAGTPAAWSTYFAVENTDAAVATAVELGGGIVQPLRDSPYGRIGVVTDTQGAV